MNLNNFQSGAGRRLGLLLALAACGALAQSAAKHGAAPSRPAVDPPAKTFEAKTVHGRTVYSVPTQLPDLGYQIGPSDVLAINVWHQPQLDQKEQVRPDGRISLPLLGTFPVAGMTTGALRQLLTTKLAKYYNQPVVTVIVVKAQSHTYNVMGRVMHPGQFLLNRPTTVLDALAEAGGFKDFANKGGIYVLRRLANGVMVRIRFNYNQVIQGQRMQENVDLSPNDTVVVP